MYRLLVFIVLVIGLLKTALCIRQEYVQRIHFGKSVANINISKGKVSIANREEFPYVAALEYTREHLCGAVVIGPNAFLTSAQCVEGKDTPYMMIRTGGVFAVDLGSQTNSVQYSRVRHVKIHPDFRNGTAIIDNDIAIIWTYKNFNFTSAVNQIIMAETKTEVFFGETAVILGWGKTEKGKLSNVLLKGSLQVLRDNFCRLLFRKLFTKKMICAADPLKKVTPCDADQGGPLILHNPKNPNEDLLIGLMTFSARTEQNTCDAKMPTIFIKISEFRQWVLDELHEFAMNQES